MRHVFVVALVPEEDLAELTKAFPTATTHAIAEVDPAALRFLPIKDFTEYYARPATDVVVTRYREAHGGT